MFDEPSPQLRDRLRSAARWSDASPSEVVGLAVLLTGAVALTAMLWWQAQPQPVTGAAQPAPAALSSPAPVAPSTAATPAAPQTVHVVGAVVAPGIVTVHAGARVADVIAAAGGATLAAETAALNLARPVTDGERIAVPAVGDDPPAMVAPQPPAATGAEAPGAKVDVNTATLDQLDELPGIGEVLAGRILDYREANDGFASTGELREVSGIGEKTFQDLADLVTVS